MAMRSISSADGKTWGAPDGAGNPCYHGPALTEYRGELYGAWVCTQQGYENVPFLFKYKDGKMPAWGGNSVVPSTWKALGRISTSVLDDKYYMAYRGATSGNYLVAISSSPLVSTSWTLAKPGKPADVAWAFSPSICAFQGSLIIVGVSANYEFYWQQMSASGTIEKDWAKIEGHKTIQSPALCVYHNELYMTYCAENSNDVWWLKMASKAEATWTIKFATRLENQISSPSACVHSDDKFYTISTIAGGAMYYFSTDMQNVGSAVAVNSSVRALGAPGIGSDGGKLYVTFAQASATSVYSKALSGEGVVVEENDSDDDDEIYQEKLACQPRYDSHAVDTLFPTADPSAQPRRRWYSRLLCL